MNNPFRCSKRYLQAVGALYGNAEAPKAVKRKKRSYPERDLVHLPVMTWCREHPICSEHMIHIANERQTTHYEGGILKAMGVKAGCSDLFLAFPCDGYSGYWIELKAPGKHPSEAQVRWLNLMAKVGYKADWFDNAQATIKAIKLYLGE